MILYALRLSALPRKAILYLHNPDVSFAPLIQQLRLQDGKMSTNVRASAKTFPLSVQFSILPLLALRNISAAHWKLFWSLSLTIIQRNVVYRLITGSIPHRRLLHYIMPRVFDSPSCLVCLHSVDSAAHLLFLCPSKEKIWQGIIFEFLWPTTTVGDVMEALLSLDFSNIWYCQIKNINPYKILLIALSQIWLAHMRFIFDKVPILPTAILATIRSHIHQRIAEDQCHSLL